MIDFAKITVRAGAGGNGCGSFHHIKGKRYGKASGGNGGNGGNVYIEATTNLNTLEPYRFVKDYQAPNGQSGLSNLRRGANGKDLVLKVPVGTTVKISNFKFQISNSDLVTEGDKILISSGGQGGRGNAYLRDQFGRRPRTGETGQPGKTCHITLELKLIADVGLIGLPNAGKSTLLASLTAAHPAIAPYPFTTLEPNLGVLIESGSRYRVPGTTFEVFSSRRPDLTSKVKNPEPDTRQLILADIPGLIEGASEGKGLGHQFLRHIERTKVLVHLIDMSASYQVPGTTFEAKRPTPGVGSSRRLEDTLGVLLTWPTSKVKNPEPDNLWLTYQAIRNELKTYSKELTKKKEIIVLTKIDLVDKEELMEAKTVFSNHHKKTIAVSAVSEEGLEELVKRISQAVEAHR